MLKTDQLKRFRSSEAKIAFEFLGKNVQIRSQSLKKSNLRNGSWKQSRNKSLKSQLRYKLKVRSFKVRMACDSKRVRSYWNC